MGSKKTDSPFGKATRLRVLRKYLATAGTITPNNAWKHVYRCLLWMEHGTSLAHIYDANHMRQGGNFHGRAKRFTAALCREWNISRNELPERLDYLFKGCVEAWRAQAEQLGGLADEDADIEEELESELIADIAQVLFEEEMAWEDAERVARRIEKMSHDFFTVANKRKNALGEGFEDLLEILLREVSGIPAKNVCLRKPVSKMPGFLRSPILEPGQKKQREPHPDLAIVDDDKTYLIATAKWSMRQDRETQFQSEYDAYQRNKRQSTELRYALITNEFDLARLRNVAMAMPGGTGGYVFHRIYHINLDLLRATHNGRFEAEVENVAGAAKFASLSTFLSEMKSRYGAN